MGETTGSISKQDSRPSLAGPVIEFLDNVPLLVSAGHDGLFYYRRPFDEIFIIARNYGDTEGQSVDIWLPYGEDRHVSNEYGRIDVKVHRSGVLWHDRTREIEQSRGKTSWLSSYGFTESDPREASFVGTQLLAHLPGSPMDNSIQDMNNSRAWTRVKDFHTRHRDWFVCNEKPIVSRAQAKKLERDASLVKRLKETRGTACQICRFSFPKKDGDLYCEVHHLEWLSNGGLDTPSNMIVLCANCHKQFHYGNVEIVSHSAFQIEILINGIRHKCVVG